MFLRDPGQRPSEQRPVRGVPDRVGVVAYGRLMPGRVAVYAGSFDPVTLGHEDIVRRGAKLFDRLVVGVGINPDKRPLFTAEERQDLLSQVFADLPNVSVECFTALTLLEAMQPLLKFFDRLGRSVVRKRAEVVGRSPCPDLRRVLRESSGCHFNVLCWHRRLELNPRHRYRYWRSWALIAPRGAAAKTN